jgi:hypothetical protein
VAEVEGLARVEATAASSAVEVLDAGALDSFAFGLMVSAVVALLRCTAAPLMLGSVVRAEAGIADAWASVDAAYMLAHIGFTTWLDDVGSCTHQHKTRAPSDNRRGSVFVWVRNTSTTDNIAG